MSKSTHSEGTLYRAARLEVLSAALADRLESDLPSDPLTPVRILVPSAALAHWLRQELAERRGIQANVSFLRPADLLIEIGRRAGLEVDPAANDPWAPDAVAWAVAEVLPQLLDDPTFEVVAVYVAEEPSQPGDTAPPVAGAPVSGRFFALASELARVLDRCLSLRPDLVRAWRDKDYAAGAAGAVPAWLPRLWEALAEKLHAPDPVARLDAALAALASPSEPLPQDERLWVFGVGALDPLHVEALVGLLERDQAALFLQTPSDVAWRATRDLVAGDATWRTRARRDETVVDGLRELRDAGDPLRASLGRCQRDLGIALAAAWPDPTDATASLDAPFPPLTPAAAAPALAVLQSRLAADAPLPTDPSQRRALAPGDDTLQLHTCYGPRRQVEVLREALLHLFEEHPQLEPRDVLVLTPDLSTYAPLVSAAFAQGALWQDQGSWGVSGTPRLPVEVTDVAVRTVNPVADALVRVLDLAGARLEVSVVFDLLALEPVRDRFNLSTPQLADLETWVRDAGVRWGRDAAHRARLGLPEDPQNSWSWGLDRLAYGVSRAEDGDPLVRVGADLGSKDFAPVDDLVVAYDAAEGDSTVSLGWLLEFWARFTECLDSLQDARPIAEWADALETVVGSLTRSEGQRAWQSRQVLDEVVRLREPGSAQKVSRAAVQAALAGRFDQGLLRARPGCLTLAALRPGRVTPRRVICLLGMDEGSFPRNPSRPAFDPTTRAPRVTDPLTRDRDRGAFLEALLGARKHLLVLYTGHDERTNEERAPAIPVSELRDTLNAVFLPATDKEPASAALTRSHPLQPFATACFRADRPRAKGGAATPWSFDQRLLEHQAAYADQGETSYEFFPKIDASEPEIPAEPMELEELTRFLKDPTKTLLQGQLKLTLVGDRDLVPPSDREPCEINHLDRWKLKEAMRVACVEGGDPDAVGMGWLATGQLQPGQPGGREAEDARARTWGLLEVLEPWLGPAQDWREPDPALAIDLRFGEDRLIGQVGDIHGEFLISVTVGKIKENALLAAWVRLLACAATDPSKRWRAVHLGVVLKGGEWKIAGEGLELPVASPDEREEFARTHLEELLHIARQGRVAPLPLFKGSSFVFAKTMAWSNLTPARIAQSGFEGLPAEQAELLEKALAQALNKWMGGKWAPFADSADPYVQRVYGDQCPLFEGGVVGAEPSRHFAQLALALWQPLWQARCTYGRKTRESGLGPVKSWLPEISS
jgi:exodeoxyribonuclease V gamma subunit